MIKYNIIFFVDKSTLNLANNGKNIFLLLLFTILVIV